MKVLMQMDLAEELIEEIRQVAEEVEVVQVESDAAALEVMPEIEVVCGHISEEMFARRQKLKWMQSWGAGSRWSVAFRTGRERCGVVQRQGVGGGAFGRTCDGVVARADAGDPHGGAESGVGSSAGRFALRRGNWLSRRWALWDWEGLGGSWRSGRARSGCGLSRWIQKRSKCRKQWKPAGGWINSTRCWNNPTWWRFVRR